MPNETLIAEIENLISEIISLGGENERSQIVPNLTVQNANPTGLDGWLIISDDRDGDNILARKVGSVVYSDNDLVNVMFLRGTEPIAFQQGSESSNNGIWEIVTGTSTDIYYDKGDVGIGKSVAPDAALEVLDASQAQLRLTHTEDTDFVDFQIDTNADLTITPSGTGQIILQPTTDSTDFFQVLDADGGNPVLNVDSTNERISIGGNTPAGVLEIGDGAALSSVSPLIVSQETSTHALQVTSTITTSSSPQILRFVPTIAPTGAIANIFGANINPSIAGSSSFAVTNLRVVNADFSFGGSYGGTLSTAYSVFIGEPADNSSGSPAVTTHYGLYIEDLAFATNNWAVYVVADTKSYFGGDVGIGQTSIAAKLHVDQSSATGAKPVLYLDQADVSEEMMEFNTTIGVGNAIEAVGAKTLTTTHFVKVTLPGGLTRYFPVGTIA